MKIFTKLCKLIEAATPGPWYAIPHPEWKGSPSRIGVDPSASWASFGEIAYVSPHNAAIICALRNHAPAILALWEAARDMLNHCRACRGAGHAIIRVTEDSGVTYDVKHECSLCAPLRAALDALEEK